MFGIKKGDKIKLLTSFHTGKQAFLEGEILVVTDTGVLGIDAKDPADETRWVTELSCRDFQKWEE